MNQLLILFADIDLNNHTKEIIIIQTVIRMFLTKKRILIPNSLYQTKLWRKNQSWYKTGKSNECEKYQINIIEQISNLKLEKTNFRLNKYTNQLIDIRCPNMLDNGFDYTENFDGYQLLRDKKIFYNLKFVCDSGGSQTRSLREVYHFIECQLKFMLENENYIFINILDGDTSYKNMNKYHYLANREIYKTIQKKYLLEICMHIKIIGSPNQFDLKYIHKSNKLIQN